MSGRVEDQTLHIQLLGDFALTKGITPITSLYAPRLQALLALLILNRESAQSRQQLAFSLWPDSSESQAQTNLRNLIYQVRHLLPDADHFLMLSGRMVQWRADSSAVVDCIRFEQSLRGSKEREQLGDLQTATNHMEEAIQWYRGDLLPTCYDEWILPQRERLRGLFVNALAHLASILEMQRDYAKAILYMQRLLQVEPLQETGYLAMMRLHALNGDRAAALHTYQFCSEILQRELAAEPGQALRMAYARLVAYDTPSLAPRSSGNSSLIGRKHEWSRMLSCWQAAVAGGAQCVLLSGEAGVGKTRLAEELLYWVERQGMSAARAQCYPHKGDLAYTPITAWLGTPVFRPALAKLSPIWRAEIARLAPELIEEGVSSEPITESWQRRRLFEALNRAILGAEQPLLLILDDLQWCDQETIEWLHYFLHTATNPRLLVVGLVRTEIQSNNGLEGFLAHLRERGQITEIPLDALSESDSLALAQQIAGNTLSRQFLASLYAATEGNPLFIVELVRADREGWQHRPTQEIEHTGADLFPPLPPRIIGLLNARLSALSPLARELAGLAATIGRLFDSSLLAHAGGYDDATLVQGLDELWSRRIIRERGEYSYDFCHDKLREVAYAQLSSARRHLLHRRIAEALEALPGAQIEARWGQIALHYQQAGLIEQAARAYLSAAETANRISSYAQSVQYCQDALHLLEPARAVQPGHALAASIATRLGRSLAALERHAEARDAYALALTCTLNDAVRQRACLHRLTANTWRAQAHFTAAEQEYDRAALECAQALVAEPVWDEWIELQLDRLETYTWQGRASAVQDEQLENLQHITAMYGAMHQSARLLLQRLFLAFWHDGCVVDEAALVRIDQLLAMSNATGVGQLIAIAHWVAGQSRLLRHELEQAGSYLDTALGWAEQLGDMQLQARCLASLSILARRQRQPELVQVYNERGGALASTYGFNDILGVVEANRAWLAWREHDLLRVAEHGQRARQFWEQSPILFPFQWIALLLLVAAAVADNDLAEAATLVWIVLAQTQQRLPAALENALHAAATSLSPVYFRRALALAEQFGLL